MEGGAFGDWAGWVHYGSAQYKDSKDGWGRRRWDRSAGAHMGDGQLGQGRKNRNLDRNRSAELTGHNSTAAHVAAVQVPVGYTSSHPLGHSFGRDPRRAGRLDGGRPLKVCQSAWAATAPAVRHARSRSPNGRTGVCFETEYPGRLE